MATVNVQGRSIPAPVYLEGIRRAKANPETTFITSLHVWRPATGAEIMRQYRQDLHKRINARGNLKPLNSRASVITYARWRCRHSMAAYDLRALNRHQRRKLEQS